MKAGILRPKPTEWMLFPRGWVDPCSPGGVPQYLSTFVMDRGRVFQKTPEEWLIIAHQAFSATQLIFLPSDTAANDGARAGWLVGLPGAVLKGASDSQPSHSSHCQVQLSCPSYPVLTLPSCRRSARDRWLEYAVSRKTRSQGLGGPTLLSRRSGSSGDRIDGSQYTAPNWQAWRLESLS